MNEKKYVVPEGMMNAATQGATAYTGLVCYPATIQAAVEAAVRWLAENPIVPDVAQCVLLLKAASVTANPATREIAKLVAHEWQRRMFLAPEPRMSEVVKDLLWLDPPVDLLAADDCGGAITQEANLRILEAYRRGRISHDEK